MSLSTSDNSNNTKTKHHVIIIGAGFGGNGVIKSLLNGNDGNKIPDNMDVTLIDRKTTFSISATWQFIWSSRIKVGGGDDDGDVVKIPEWDMSNLKANNTATGIKFIKGENDATVVNINTSNKQITLSNANNITYDTLVLSPGVISDSSLVKGLADSNALDICSATNVPKIKSSIDNLMEEAASCTGTAATPKTVLMCVTKMPYKVSKYIWIFLCFYFV